MLISTILILIALPIIVGMAWSMRQAHLRNQREVYEALQMEIARRRKSRVYEIKRKRKKP